MIIEKEELDKILSIAESTHNQELKDILGVVIMFSQENELLHDLAVQSLFLLNEDIGSKIDLDTFNYH